MASCKRRAARRRTVDDERLRSRLSRGALVVVNNLEFFFELVQVWFEVAVVQPWASMQHDNDRTFTFYGKIQLRSIQLLPSGKILRKSHDGNKEQYGNEQSQELVVIFASCFMQRRTRHGGKSANEATE